MNIGRKRSNKDAAHTDTPRTGGNPTDAERVSAMDQAANMDPHSEMDRGSGEPAQAMTERMERPQGPGGPQHGMTADSAPAHGSSAAATDRVHSASSGEAEQARSRSHGNAEQPATTAPGYGESGRGTAHSGDAGRPGSMGRTGGNGGERLLAEADMGRLRDQWREVQSAFVDDPKDAVTKADQLVDNTIAQLTESCAQRRKDLSQRWSRGESVDTEELRQALRGYRDLFDQLVGTASAARNM